MNTRNLQCFQTVYEERNLQAAANKLFMSPQGLSKIIKNLEEDCKTPLFTRTKDGFVPTESGRIFYEKSKVILGNIRDMFIAIEAVSEKEKRFKFGFAVGTIRALDVTAINDLMIEYPEVVAKWDELENQTVLDKVLNDEINCGMVVGKPDVPGLAYKLVKSVDIAVYVYNGHRFWNQEMIDIKEIKGEPLVSMNARHRIFHDIMDACHSNEFHPNVVGMVGEGETICKLVKNKIGIGIIPRFFPDDDEIRGIPISDAYTWDVYGVYKESSPDATLAKKLLEEI